MKILKGKIILKPKELNPNHLIPVTTAWHIFLLRIEEQPRLWKVPAKKLNKQA